MTAITHQSAHSIYLRRPRTSEAPDARSPKFAQRLAQVIGSDKKPFTQVIGLTAVVLEHDGGDVACEPDAGEAVDVGAFERIVAASLAVTTFVFVVDASSKGRALGWQSGVGVDVNLGVCEVGDGGDDDEEQWLSFIIAMVESSVGAGVGLK